MILDIIGFGVPKKAKQAGRFGPLKHSGGWCVPIINVDQMSNSAVGSLAVSYKCRITVTTETVHLNGAEGSSKSC